MHRMNSEVMIERSGHDEFDLRLEWVWVDVDECTRHLASAAAVISPAITTAFGRR
jgi:hypothetical protein